MRVDIDGKTIEAAKGMTILEAARENGIHIPSLCYLREINCISVCRVCVVEVNGDLVPACSTFIREGMQVITDSQKVFAARRKNLELVCSDHLMDCTDCRRGADCELRNLCKVYEVDDRAFGIGKRKAMFDSSTPYLVRDNTKCMLCRRCEAVCERVQGIKAVAANNKGGETNIGFGLPLAETDCVGCGQCVAVCPTGALLPKDDTKKAWKAIFDKEKFVVAAVAPSACMRIGEFFGETPGTDCSKKLTEIFRKMGFDAVVDLAESKKTAEQLTISKAAEYSKFMLSGECPAWRRYIKNRHPELADKLIEPYNWRIAIEEAYADRDVFVAEITNCISGKEDSFADVLLSTREAFEMMRRACVSSFTADKIWSELTGENFDPIPQPGRMFTNECNVLSVSGIAEGERALALCEEYALISVQACPGGCIYGGGMPRRNDI